MTLCTWASSMFKSLREKIDGFSSALTLSSSCFLLSHANSLCCVALVFFYEGCIVARAAIPSAGLVSWLRPEYERGCGHIGTTRLFTALREPHSVVVEFFPVVIRVNSSDDDASYGCLYRNIYIRIGAYQIQVNGSKNRSVSML